MESVGLSIPFTDMCGPRESGSEQLLGAGTPREFDPAEKRMSFLRVSVDDDDDDDDDDVYYSKGRRPREDEEGEESYEKRRQRPGRGG